jgi:hypothetical protein
MKNRQLESGNFVVGARDSNGYLKKCRDCGRAIYLCQNSDGVWRPFAAWIEGDAAEVEWVLHQCSRAIEAH